MRRWVWRVWCGMVWMGVVQHGVRKGVVQLHGMDGRCGWGGCMVWYHAYIPIWPVVLEHSHLHPAHCLRSPEATNLQMVEEATNLQMVERGAALTLQRVWLEGVRHMHARTVIRISCLRQPCAHNEFAIIVMFHSSADRLEQGSSHAVVHHESEHAEQCHHASLAFEVAD